MIQKLRPLMVCMLLVLCGVTQSFAQKPDRSVLAMKMPSGEIYLGWRLFAADPDDIGFNIYRKSGESGDPVLRNDSPLTYRTNFTDKAPEGTDTYYYYYVVPVINGAEGEPSVATAIMDNKGLPYFEFDMEVPADFMFTGVSDLDGDGLNDYLIQLPKKYIDPYCPNWNTSGGSTYKIHAYNHYGEFMWSFDRGVDIEMGIWYAPLITYDFDGDGKAEVALKGGNGDHRDASGRVFSGPEFLYVLDGATGDSLTSAPWPAREKFLAEPESCEKGTAWEGYNRASRNLMSIAYLDGTTPHIIASRGTYGYQVTKAYKFSNNLLNEVWEWDNDELDATWWGQGAHFQHGVDVDNDGKDEVVLGASVLNHDGTPRWSSGIGHVDHAYVGDILPSRPGLEMYYGAEYHKAVNGLGLLDASTGEQIWGVDFEIKHAHREGMVADIDPDSPGLECYSQSRDNGAVKYLHSADGRLLSNIDIGEAPETLYWDDDITKEFIYGGTINKYDNVNQSYTPVAPFEGRIVVIADIMGDWREEIVTAYQNKIRVYSTITPTNHMFNWLMEDRVYKTDVAAQSMGYFQPAMSSTNLTEDTRKDCNGVAGGDAYIDKCETCVGGNTGLTACPMDCTGVIDGGAYYDDCGICVEGSTGLPPCVVLQEAQAEYKCAGFSAITSEYKGFTGKGYVRQSNSSAGGDIVWGLNSAVAQTVDIYITYSFGSGSARTVDFLVDEVVQGSHTFQPTPDWYTWERDTVSVDLPAGVVSFKIATSHSLPNVDKIEWRSNDLTIAKCDEKAIDCFGIWGGSAIKDDCEVCVEGLTGLTACEGIVMEAEDGYCLLDGEVQNSFEGSYGGYVNTDNATGKSITWALNAQNDVSTELYVRYANGASSDRSANVFVNDQLQVEGAGFKNTGGYHIWDGYTLNLNLKAGNNKIEIRALTSGGVVLIDRLVWTDPTVSAGSCEGISVVDCQGVQNGDAFIDQCGTCVGGTTNLEACKEDCNGDWGGTAITDACEVCVEGNTGKTACSASVLEAEAAYCLLDGVVQNSFEGSFDGYVNTDNAIGKSVSWALEAAANVTIELLVRYSNGAVSDRSANVFVNGALQAEAAAFLNTGGYDVWGVYPLNLNLQAGTNEIRITSLTEGGVVLIDRIVWEDATVVAGNCSDISNVDCQGVENGTAYTDKCGICVGGTTGLEPCVTDCNGVQNGSAYIDNCGLCVGGDTGQTENVSCGWDYSLQGEAQCNLDGSVDNDNEGYAGTGFVNTTNSVNSFVAWGMNSDVAQTITLHMRIANGGTTDRPVRVLVNGAEQISNLSLPGTGGWSVWDFVSFEVDFAAGNNTLRLESLTGAGAANIDFIAWSSPALQAASCEQDCNGVLGGSAYTDDCGVCVGGDTGFLPCVSDIFELEAEDSYCQLDGEVQSTTQTGYSGTGFINTSDAVGSVYAFSLHSSTAQDITLSLTYSNNDAGRKMDVIINGVKQLSSIDPPLTGGWSVWTTLDMAVSLSAGDNYIELNPVTSKGLVLADKFNWTASGITEGTCLNTTDCAGVAEGTAYKDNCNVCVGGTTGKDPCSELQAEDFCSLDGVVETHFSGTTGTGAINSDNITGAKGTWAFESATAQAAVLKMRYSCDDPSGRPADVYVNGELQISGFIFPQTGGWSSWKEAELNINLAAGVNKVDLVATTAGGLTVIDRFSWNNSTITTGDCNAEPSADIFEKEAEDSYCELIGEVQSTTQTGYSGTGFINTSDAVGSVYAFSLHSSTAQDITLSLTYSNNDAGRKMDVIINGVKQLSAIDPPLSGGWSVWATLDMAVSLSAGDNYIELNPVTSKGLVLADKFNWTASGITEGNCLNTTDCAGVAEGTAYKDNCNVCVGGTTGKDPCSELQAEDFCSLDGVVETHFSGTTGTGAINSDNITGAKGSWAFESTTAQAAVLKMRYSCDDPSGRPADVYVNGELQVSGYIFPQTGGWSSWKEAELNINFAAGVNKVDLVATTAGGLTVIDRFSWNNSSITTGDCSANLSAMEFEVEDNICSFDGLVESEYNNFSGSGYIKSHNSSGASYSFALNSPVHQTIDLIVTFSNGEKGGLRPVRIYVNDSLQSANNLFPVTGGWSVWDTLSVKVTLEAGNNLVKFYPNAGSGLVYIDKLAWKEPGVSLGSCKPAATGTLQDINSGNSKKGFTGFEIPEEEISIYPNPVGNFFFIEPAPDGKVSLFNVTGVEMEVSMEAEGSGMKVNTEHLPAGSYLLKIERETETKFYKLIK